MARSTRITIETESLLVLQGRQLLRTWCPQCGCRAEMIPLDTLGVVSNLPHTEIQAWMEASDCTRRKRPMAPLSSASTPCSTASVEPLRRTHTRADLATDNFNDTKGETMKLSNTAKTTTLIALFVLALTAAPAAKAACSNATLRGTYSDQDTGTIVGVGPFTGVNLDIFDGKGHLGISGISSLNGSVSAGTETGTYQVNPDCTGTYTVSGGGLTVDAFFVINQNGNELQIVITDPGTVISCVARKQFPEN